MRRRFEAETPKMGGSVPQPPPGMALYPPLLAPSVRKWATHLDLKSRRYTARPRSQIDLRGKRGDRGPESVRQRQGAQEKGGSAISTPPLPSPLNSESTAGRPEMAILHTPDTATLQQKRRRGGGVTPLSEARAHHGHRRCPPSTPPVGSLREIKLAAPPACGAPRATRVLPPAWILAPLPAIFRESGCTKSPMRRREPPRPTPTRSQPGPAPSPP